MAKSDRIVGIVANPFMPTAEYVGAMNSLTMAFREIFSAATTCPLISRPDVVREQCVQAIALDSAHTKCLFLNSITHTQGFASHADGPGLQFQFLLPCSLFM